MSKASLTILVVSLTGLVAGGPAAASPRCKSAELDRALRGPLPPSLLLQAVTEACTLPDGLRAAVIAYLGTGDRSLASVAGSRLLEWLPFVMARCPGAPRKLSRVVRNAPRERATSAWLRACGLERLAPGGAPNVPLARGLLAVALYGWLSPGDPRRARAVAEHLLQEHRPQPPPPAPVLLRLPRLDLAPKPDLDLSAGPRAAASGPAAGMMGGDIGRAVRTGRLQPRRRVSRVRVTAVVPRSPAVSPRPRLLSAIRRRVLGLRRCYQRALQSNPTLRARARISLTLTPSGRVTSVRVRGTEGAFRACLRNRVRRWRLVSMPARAYHTFAVRFEPAPR